MGAKTKTVGGGSATGVAGDFNNFLRQGLNNGTYGATGQAAGIGSSINSLLGGQGQPVSGLDTFQSMLGSLSQRPGASFNPSTLSLGGFSPLAPSGGMDLGMGLGSSFGGSPFSLSSNPSSVTQTGTNGFDINSLMSRLGQQFQLNDINPAINNVNSFAQGIPTNPNSSGLGNTSEFNAISQIANNQSQRDIADIRERYGISSAGLNAENSYRAQAIPQLTQALSQAALQQRQAGQQDIGLGLQGAGLGLQGLSTGLQGLLGGREQDINAQYGLGNLLLGGGNLGLGATQNLLTQRGQDINSRQGDLSTLLGARGQDLSSFLGSRNADISQLGLLSQNALGQRGLDINSILGQGQFGLDQNNMNNQFSQNAYGLNSSFLQSLLSSALGGANLGLGINQLSQQGQLGALGQLFGAYQQANQLGTPQAQIVQQPSTFQNILGGITGLAGAAAPFFGAGGSLLGLLGRGGGGGGQIPDLSSLIGMQLPRISQTPSYPTYTPQQIASGNLPRL